MNERIKELAEQAGFDVKRLLEPYPGGFPREDFLALESFAELIVLECIKEIEFQHGGGSDMDSEWDRAIECVSSMVKYRFGVEK